MLNLSFLVLNGFNVFGAKYRPLHSSLNYVFARTLSNILHKNKLKMDKDLKVRPETIKLLQENIGRTLDDINQSKILYDPPPRITETKTKVNQWVLIKLKRFCTAKETISKVKRQPSEWEKIIANRTTDKGLISKIYKQLIQLNTRKTNHTIKKWQKDLNRHLFKEDIQMETYMERCSLLEKCKSKL